MDAFYISVFSIIAFAVLYFPASKIWADLFWEKTIDKTEMKHVHESSDELKYFKDAA